jgi:hypothetical protein
MIDVKWLAHVKPEKLPEDYQLAIGAIGLEAVIKLAFALPKVHLYLMSPDKLFIHAKEAYVRQQHAQACPEHPFSARRVALEAGLSEGYVYELLRSDAEEKKQGNLFD